MDRDIWRETIVAGELKIDPKWKKALDEGDRAALDGIWTKLERLPEEDRPDATTLSVALWTLARKLPPASAEWLCEHGADPLHATLDEKRGSSDAITVAIAGENYDLLNWFFNNKVTAPITPSRLLAGGDRPPLVEALFEGREDVAEFLLNSGADINQANALGTTALHQMASAYRVSACVFLVEHGADPTIQNFARVTPCEVVPETQAFPWNPDCVFEMLDGYCKFVEDGGKPGAYPIPEDVRDEAALERVGETFKAKPVAQWTPDDQRAARTLAARNAAASEESLGAGEALRPLRPSF